QLLRKGYWLLLRTQPDTKDCWRIRKVQRINDILEWRETTGTENVLAVLTLLDLKKLASYDSPTDYCPCIVASMETTCIRFGNNSECWLDFSSWLRYGKSGMYVVGSSKIDGVDYSLDQLRSIFDNQDLYCVPSKYFVCMQDIFPE